MSWHGQGGATGGVAEGSERCPRPGLAGTEQERCQARGHRRGAGKAGGTPGRPAGRREGRRDAGGQSRLANRRLAGEGRPAPGSGSSQPTIDPSVWCEDATDGDQLVPAASGPHGGNLFDVDAHTQVVALGLESRVVATYRGVVVDGFGQGVVHWSYTTG
jgi:hypothetical protein